MNHGWDDSTWQDRAARGERELFERSRIAPDPEVEKRDRLREEERRRSINQSPWSIGTAYYDQRDLYTCNASIEEDGYGVGPSYHPEEGSYAYRRDYGDHEPIVLRVGDANIYEREAWPWLNYTADDPYFAFLHEGERGFWRRLKLRVVRGLHLGRESREAKRLDRRITADVCDALSCRGDLDATDIDVSVRGREVTLAGTVPNWRSKRVAEEVASGIPGVRAIHNRLEIRRDDPRNTNIAFAFHVGF